MTQVHAADACFSVMYSQKVLGSKSETHSCSGFRNVLHLINARFPSSYSGHACVHVASSCCRWANGRSQSPEKLQRFCIRTIIQQYIIVIWLARSCSSSSGSLVHMLLFSWANSRLEKQFWLYLYLPKQLFRQCVTSCWCFLKQTAD